MNLHKLLSMVTRLLTASKAASIMLLITQMRISWYYTTLFTFLLSKLDFFFLGAD